MHYSTWRFFINWIRGNLGIVTGNHSWDLRLESIPIVHALTLFIWYWLTCVVRLWWYFELQCIDFAVSNDKIPWFFRCENRLRHFKRHNNILKTFILDDLPFSSKIWNIVWTATILNVVKVGRMHQSKQSEIEWYLFLYRISSDDQLSVKWSACKSLSLLDTLVRSKKDHRWCVPRTWCLV